MTIVAIIIIIIMKNTLVFIVLDQGTSCEVHVQTPYLMLLLPLVCSQWVFRDDFFFYTNHEFKITN